MKINLFASIIVFVSAYSPLALILAVKDFNVDEIYFNNPTISLGILGLGLISIIILNIVINDMNCGHQVTIQKITNKSNALINYTIPYMISFFGFDMTKSTDLVAFLLFMVLLCLLTIRTQMIFINPILVFKGYNLFDITYKEGNKIKEGIFITKQMLEIDKNYLIEKISNFTYLITKKV